MNAASIGVSGARAPTVNQLPPRATLRAKKRKSRSRLRRERSARLGRTWMVGDENEIVV